MTFTEAAILVLKENENKPMSSREIWNDIENKKIPINSKGKTPAATLNTKILSHTINSNIARKSKNLVFEIVESSPLKFRLIKFVPSRIRESLIEDGFVTMDKLNEILFKIEK